MEILSAQDRAKELCFDIRSLRRHGDQGDLTRAYHVFCEHKGIQPEQVDSDLEGCIERICELHGRYWGQFRQCVSRAISRARQ